MNARMGLAGRRFWLALSLLATLSSVGCLQTNIGGQTLPSAYYLDDDVQYFPMGPETKLSNQIRALERYKVEQQATEAGAAGGAY